jgi:polyisoprenoid-binding protein YceI
VKKLAISVLALSLVACGNSVKSATASDSQIFSDLPQLSGDYVWTMDRSASALTFTATHLNEFTGSFSNFDAAIKLNPDDPSTGQIIAMVDLSSVDAGTRERNDNLLLSDWFNIDTYPVARFESQTIEATSEGYRASGDLTIKGQTQPVNLDFTLNVDGKSARAQGGFSLDRRDFDIGTGSDFETEEWVAFPVEVNLDIVANR